MSGRRARSLPVVLAALAITAAIAACGGGSASPSAAASSQGGGGGSGDGLLAVAQDFSYTLNKTSLPAGNVNVTLENKGAVPHTLTFYTDAAFTAKVEGGDSKDVAAGSNVGFSFTVPAAPALFFRCEIHPTQMSGQIAVQ